jgi:hypothetical protein
MRSGSGTSRIACLYLSGVAVEGRSSLFDQSRSDCVKVAVGFSPRDNDRDRLCVAERRLNRRADRALHASLRVRPVFALPPRGLKPTATITTSLCEAEPAQSRHPESEMRPPTFEWIGNHSNARLQLMEKPHRRRVGAAWRHAAETWLRCQGQITLSLNQKVLHHLPLSWLHH